MRKPGPKSYDWTTGFLSELEQSGNITFASKAAGISRQEVFRRRKTDPLFDKNCREAMMNAADVLEQEAWRRAIHGVDCPTTIAGEREVVKKYSDTLLIFLMKGANPGKYAERRKIEHSRDDDDDNRVSGKSPEQLREETVARLRALLGPRQN